MSGHDAEMPLSGEAEKIIADLLDSADPCERADWRIFLQACFNALDDGCPESIIGSLATITTPADRWCGKIRAALFKRPGFAEDGSFLLIGACRMTEILLFNIQQTRAADPCRLH